MKVRIQKRINTPLKQGTVLPFTWCITLQLPHQTRDSPHYTSLLSPVPPLTARKLKLYHTSSRLAGLPSLIHSLPVSNSPAAVCLHLKLRCLIRPPSSFPSATQNPTQPFPPPAYFPIKPNHDVSLRSRNSTPILRNIESQTSRRFPRALGQRRRRFVVFKTKEKHS